MFCGERIRVALRLKLTRGAQVQSLKNLGLNISRAEVGEGGSGRNRFYITDAKVRPNAAVGPPPWPLRNRHAALLRAQLAPATLRPPLAQRPGDAAGRRAPPERQHCARLVRLK